tara:strand:- start:1338 stop:1736 length:399 start_codon:yes stop_codon:yes gene_type:complete
MSLFSPQWPLRRGENTYEPYQTIDQQIAFYLKNLLLTSPGENISQPFYGVGLRSFLFEQHNNSSYSSILAKIDSQISRYLPYLDNVNITVDSNSRNVDGNNLSVRIEYTIKNDTERRLFDLNIDDSQTIGLY